jgi:hypothetical protein
VGEIPEALRAGEEALFVAPGDVAGLAAQLQRLLGDDALRQRLESQGRALYEARFSMRRFFEDLARIHQQVFGASAALPAGPGRSPAAAAAPEAAALAREEATS